MSDDPDKIMPFVPKPKDAGEPTQRDRIGNVQRVHFERLHRQKAEQEAAESQGEQYIGAYETIAETNKRVAAEARATDQKQKERLEINKQALDFIRDRKDAIESEIAEAVELNRERTAIRAPGYTPKQGRRLETISVSIFSELFYSDVFARNPQALVDAVNAWLRQKYRVPTVQMEGKEGEEIVFLDYKRKAEVPHR